jgi:hypothetical protein
MKSGISLLRSQLSWKHFLLFFPFLFVADKGWSQAPCSAAVTYTVNLTGKSDSTWNSPLNISRTSNPGCCSTPNGDRCIQFILTLDSGSSGIYFDYDGANGVQYRIGCDPTTYAAKNDVCLNGIGPHYITFCKPGNDAGT